MGAWEITKVFLVLGILLGIFYMIVYLIKKYVLFSKLNSNQKFSIRVLTVQPIMAKKYVSLIQMKNKYYLLGVSDHSISLIDKLDQPEEIENFESNEPALNQNVWELLKRNIIRK